jgi:hypothetical protein
LVAQVLVELLARDPRLDHAVEVLRVHRQHAIHVAEIDRDATVGRIDVALERGAGSKRNDRHATLGADAHDVLHVGRRLRKNHRVGRLVRDPSRGVGVLLAHRLRGDEAVAEFCRERGDDRLDRRGIAARHRIGLLLRQCHRQLTYQLASRCYRNGAANALTGAVALHPCVP